jgi:hypothetical protein
MLSAYSSPVVLNYIQTPAFSIADLEQNIRCVDQFIIVIVQFGLERDFLQFSK